MEKALAELRERLGEVYDLQAAAQLLLWDRATMMPPKGAESRGRQTALLRRLAHERFTDPRIGELLDELDDVDFPYDSDEAEIRTRGEKNPGSRLAIRPALGGFVWRVGEAPKLLENATGGGLTVEPYLDYLRGEVWGAL